MRNEVTELLEEKKLSELGKALKNMNPADIAQIFDEKLSREDMLIVFRLLPKETAANTFVDMDSDTQEMLVSAFSDKELKDVLSEIYTDDVVDLIEEMPANVVKRILRYTDTETRAAINDILKYPKDSAGSIMTTEFVNLKKNMTVAQAFARIRATGVDKETIYICYVTDEMSRLIGIISARSLLLSQENDIIGDVMEKNVIYVNTLEDREEVARMFDKYDFLALPVVDTEERLVGIITIDDVIDVIRQENTEDIQKMAAITPSDKSYLKIGIFETWKQRVPWLMLLMISAAFTGRIIQSFEKALAANVVLTAFIPMLMDTGGNAGGQSSATIIRALSLEEISMRDIIKIVWKEARVAMICGLTLSLFNFFKLMFIDKMGIYITLVVSLTLLLTLLIAKVVGCVMPILAKRVGFDPAVMASPFITTIVDALSLLIYFKIASSLLNI